MVLVDLAHLISLRQPDKRTALLLSQEEKTAELATTASSLQAEVMALGVRKAELEGMLGRAEGDVSELRAQLEADEAR